MIIQQIKTPKKQKEKPINIFWQQTHPHKTIGRNKNTWITKKKERKGLNSLKFQLMTITDINPLTNSGLCPERHLIKLSRNNKKNDRNVTTSHSNFDPP